jgi:hypothetical protein
MSTKLGTVQQVASCSLCSLGSRFASPVPGPQYDHPLDSVVVRKDTLYQTLPVYSNAHRVMQSKDGLLLSDLQIQGMPILDYFAGCHSLVTRERIFWYD